MVGSLVHATRERFRLSNSPYHQGDIPVRFLSLVSTFSNQAEEVVCQCSETVHNLVILRQHTSEKQPVVYYSIWHVVVLDPSHRMHGSLCYP